MQTHRKISKKSHPDQMLSTDPEEAIVSAAEPPPFRTTHAVQEVYGEGGFFSFWRGVFPTLIMVSNPSMQFMLYETMLKKLKKRRALSKKTNNGVTAVEIFLLGALAKLGATVVTYPLLVVKKGPFHVDLAVWTVTSSTQWKKSFMSSISNSHDPHVT
ncbi:hypothetical protein ACLB2K_019414 [Fragaria x ananassa]